VLIAGDMLSDVLVPMPDLYGGGDDPLGDYLAALDLFEGIASQVQVVVPGHGSVGDAAEFRVRVDRDRRYIEALRDGTDAHDPRVEQPRAGWEWVGEYIHSGNVEQAATL
jgi:glyoxylase-like metal-dependent hydrolase (beta-lactamase superfamily II)